jgi:hypothetical protein
MSNVQIHKDLGVPFFAEHIRALTESYDSKLAGVGESLSSATRQIFTLPVGLTQVALRKLRGQVSRYVEAQNDGQIDTESYLAPIN